MGNSPQVSANAQAPEIANASDLSGLVVPTRTSRMGVVTEADSLPTSQQLDGSHVTDLASRVNTQPASEHGSSPQSLSDLPVLDKRDTFEAGVIVERNDRTRPQIAAARELLKRRLGPTEVASPRLFKHLFDRNPTPLNPTYLIATITDANQEVAAMASGSVTGAGLLLVGYAVSDEKYKGHGLGTRAYEALVIAAEEVCQHQFGRSLRLLALEASHGAEGYWRRQGFGEIHLNHHSDGREKLLYLQPPLHWVRHSGEPENPEQYPDSKDILVGGRRIKFPGVNEELMLKLVGTDHSDTSLKTDVLDAIRAFYTEYYFIRGEVALEANERRESYYYALMDSYFDDVMSASDISLG
jgi:hypothetical protein